MKHETAVGLVRRESAGSWPGILTLTVGHQEFNEGRSASKFGFEICILWELKKPLGLDTLIERGYVEGPPSGRYTWVSETMSEGIGKDGLKTLFLRQALPPYTIYCPPYG